MARRIGQREQGGREVWAEALKKAAAIVRVDDGQTIHACPTLALAERTFEELASVHEKVEILLPVKGEPRFGAASEVYRTTEDAAPQP
jgi:hypothetical protein